MNIKIDNPMEGGKLKRAFKGIWIPANVWLCMDLTMQEKLFYVEIDSLDGENGCFASNEYFSNFFGISKQRVSVVLKSLVDKKYIKRQIFYKPNSKQIAKRVLKVSSTPSPTKVGYPSLRKVGDPSPTNVGCPPPTKVDDPHQQKLVVNNTVNNTKDNKGDFENSGKSKREELESWLTEKIGSRQSLNLLSTNWEHLHNRDLKLLIVDYLIFLNQNTTPIRTAFQLEKVIAAFEKNWKQYGKEKVTEFINESVIANGSQRIYWKNITIGDDKKNDRTKTTYEKPKKVFKADKNVMNFITSKMKGNDGTN